MKAKSSMAKKEIFNALEELYSDLRDKTQQQWHRDLPFEELLFDRWERARHLQFDEGANIYHNSYVYGDVRVGKNTWIGPLTLIDGTGGLTIGDYCCISTGVHIYTHDTVQRFVSGGQEPTEHRPVRIGDNCYIGPLAVIRSGVTIGSHSVIGAHSFVNTDIPPYSIAVGAPATVVGKVVLDKGGRLKFEYFKKPKRPAKKPSK